MGYIHENDLAWIQIGEQIVAGGLDLVARFRQFAVDNGIEVDNANLDKQLADAERRKAEEDAKK